MSNNSSEEEEEEEEEFCVCLETNAKIPRIYKWKCSHSFHEECINMWDNGCPVCRTMELTIPNVTWNISRNPTNTLNIEYMKRLTRVPLEDQHVYKNQWKDRGCIDSNHSMVYVHTYGVLTICEDCNTIQCFNLMHRVILNDLMHRVIPNEP